MEDANAFLRKIPKVDEVISLFKGAEEAGDITHHTLTEAIRAVLSDLRVKIMSGELSDVPDIEHILKMVRQKIRGNTSMSLRPVINASGVILHTNLGRAKMGKIVADAVYRTAISYSTLEYDTASGGRGNRQAHVEELIKKLTGAESAMVVNNNAAAVLLILSTMAKGREVIISRGELVEIGGSFRIPSVMEQSGGILVEVGTTNKTHLYDYENAINAERTAALMRVHTSNFKVVGFAEKPTLKELTDLGRKYGIPVINDIGSGALIRLEKYGLYDEPSVRESIEAGVDITCFSGDKLLGGPQSGIIAGRKKYIDSMKKNPLARALRIDKLSLAALEATLRIYINGTQERDIPTLSMLSADIDELKKKAEILCAMIKERTDRCSVEVSREYSQTGGGAVPGQTLDTFVVMLKSDTLTVNELESGLRQAETPVIARISKNRLLLDVRTINEYDFEYIATCIAQLLNV